MKIVIEKEPNSDRPRQMTAKEEYEKYWIDKGVKCSTKRDVIYYIVDVDYVPREGSRVACKFGLCIVRHSYYDLDKKEWVILVSEE